MASFWFGARGRMRCWTMGWGPFLPRLSEEQRIPKHCLFLLKKITGFSRVTQLTPEQVNTGSKEQLTKRWQIPHLWGGGSDSDDTAGDVSGFSVDICSGCTARNSHVIKTIFVHSPYPLAHRGSPAAPAGHVHPAPPRRQHQTGRLALCLSPVSQCKG